MHDIDRTTREFGETGFETEQFEMGGQEMGQGESFEFGGQGEFGQSGEYGEFGEFGEFNEFGEMGETGQGFMGEQQELALAHELLNVSNEQQLENFLGNVLRRAASFAGKAIKSPVGQALGGVLKGVAKKALPLAGGALGAWVGGPLGAKIGAGLANAAGSAMGLETQEMSGEDRELTGARQFVRLATDAAVKASQANGGNPRAIAQSAAVQAAKRFAPGLLGAGKPGMGQPGMGQGGMGQPGMQPGSRQKPGARPYGRWARQGNKIILYGA